LVSASNPAQTLREFVAQAKAAPGKLSYGSFGAGSGGHLALEALCQAAGISMIHVPYKGTGPAITDLLGGQITSVLTDLATAAGHIKAGRLRALAINGPVRSALLPEVPTFTEQGFASVEATYARFGVFATAGTPAPLVERIAADITAALRQPDLRDKFAGMGYILEGSTPAAFAATLKQDTERWGQVITKLGGLTLD
jgi:tripartite-type tricarboxylate transporter receptor subunit TctC